MYSAKMSNILPKRRGLIFVLSSPSGAGKTSIARALRQSDANIALSVSVTTRPKRPGEVDGKDYRFVSLETFEHMVSEGKFLEHATVFGNRYGTPKDAVEQALSSGHDMLFDIDWQGVQQLDQTGRRDLVSVFILPPSMQALEHRLRTRAQDPEDVVQRRMQEASSELSHWAEYDYAIVNDVLDDTVESVKKILEVERLKRHRQLTIADFVSTLRTS